MDLDQPVPFALTPKAHALLARTMTDCGCGHVDCPACTRDGWACQRCEAAFFGPLPLDGLCPDCRGRDGAT